MARVSVVTAIATLAAVPVQATAAGEPLGRHRQPPPPRPRGRQRQRREHHRDRRRRGELHRHLVREPGHPALAVPGIAHQPPTGQQERPGERERPRGVPGLRHGQLPLATRRHLRDRPELRHRLPRRPLRRSPAASYATTVSPSPSRTSATSRSRAPAGPRRAAASSTAYRSTGSSTGEVVPGVMSALTSPLRSPPPREWAPGRAPPRSPA
ncbi:hypothetical protein ACFQVA_21185 [Actinomadura keratinilytica]